MPKVALADTFLDWQLLIAAARQHAADTPGIGEILDALQERLDRARELDVERHALQARRQEATRDLQQARAEGEDLAMRARSLLKGVLGRSHEGLVQLNIRPRRPYGPRKPKEDAAPRKTGRARKRAAEPE